MTAFERIIERLVHLIVITIPYRGDKRGLHL